MWDGGVEPVSLPGGTEHQARSGRSSRPVPEVVPAAQLRHAADDARVAVDAPLDLACSLGVLGHRIAEKHQEQERQRGEHGREVREPGP